MKFLAAQIYAKLYIFFLLSFGIHLRGFGFILRSLKGKRLLHVNGLHLLFDSRAATSYARLLGNCWNEPEAHIFARKLAKSYNSIHFIDIGANIGEMVTDFARLPEFRHILALEPDPVCADIVRVNALLNGLTTIQVVQAAASNAKGTAYLTAAGTPQASLSAKRKSKHDQEVAIIALDTLLKDHPLPAVPAKSKHLTLMMVDVEGHEVSVLEGARKTIAEHTPVIIFEFNAISRSHFGLEDIRKVLGKGYTIYRLNFQGALDTDLDNTWNCVAVPTQYEKDIK